jgi:hypothetical protein
MAWLFVFASLVAGAFLEDWVRLATQNHPVRVGVVGGVALLVALMVLFVASSRALTLAVAFLFGAWGIGLVAGLDDRDHMLGYYCRYGADSRAQLEGCMKHVNTDDIDALDTPAARFARGETSTCGAGSGPYCAEAASRNASG